MINFTTLSKGLIEAHLPALIAVAADVPGEYWDAEHFLVDLPEKWALSFVAFKGQGNLIGYAIASRKDPQTIHLHHFMVTRDWRSRGVGEEMMGELLNRVADYGASRLSLKAATPRSVAFYRRNGFAEIERQGRYRQLRREEKATADRRC